jgi:hypothetical protein
MKRLKRTALVLLGIIAIVALTFAVPFTEQLKGPQMAELGETPQGIDFAVFVSWYDKGLNAERFHEESAFNQERRAILPDYKIPTTLGRVILKRVLTRFDAWTECECCYGPSVDCSLYALNNYQPPEKMRYVLNRAERDGKVLFTVSLVPNEVEHATRDFAPADASVLIAEARVLTHKGDLAFVDPSLFGPILRQINPVRAEVNSGALILWMGGKRGYAIVPDSQDCPAINRVMISGSKYNQVYKLDKF